MANEEHLKILKQGVEVWNRWQVEHPDIRPDLSGAHLSNAHLSDANLSHTDLSDADLSDADLRRADLRKADLSRADLSRADLGAANLLAANLSGANLNGAHFSVADLLAANLSGANLSGAGLHTVNLSDANLSGANLNGAHLSFATVADCDLSTVKGLETVMHGGPSTIGIDTIYRSGGKIPDVFLRGAGVPENFITYMHSLVGQPIQFFSCFISHSAKDKAFCERLYADLQAKGVRTWYFPEDAKWGDPVWGEIDRSIKVYDKLIVVCSKNSLQSGPVQREIERALNREDREHKSILFPIRLDDYIFKIWQHPRKDDVLAKVVGDFAGWRRGTTKYTDSFKRLADALKA